MEPGEETERLGSFAGIGGPADPAPAGALRPTRFEAKLVSTNSREGFPVSTDSIKGPASYFPSIEKKYGRPIAEWQRLVRDRLPAKHMELVTMLKAEHGIGHGHANAIVAHVLSTGKS